MLIVVAIIIIAIVLGKHLYNLLPGPKLNAAPCDGAIEACSSVMFILTQHSHRRIDTQQQWVVRCLRTVEAPSRTHCTK